jgi:hypothetical protein
MLCLVLLLSIRNRRIDDRVAPVAIPALEFIRDYAKIRGNKMMVASGGFQGFLQSFNDLVHIRSLPAMVGKLVRNANEIVGSRVPSRR